MRARRSASLAKRPDTLGMRADSARVLGHRDAKVWVVVTSDFQCVPCRDFALSVLPQLRRDFVDKGLVRVAFVNSPRTENFNARFAAAAALCAAATGRFWPMHDSLFSHQSVWARMDDPRPYLDSLAFAAGAPVAAQTDCTTRNRMLHRLSQDIEQSRQSGVVQVPTVFVGERRLAGEELTYTTLRNAVTQALAPR
jgi:protein-disulfide isomerase